MTFCEQSNAKMHLYQDEQQQQPAVPTTSVEELKTYLKKHAMKQNHVQLNNKQSMCVVCCNEGPTTNNVQLVRRCFCESHFPCSGHVCSCSSANQAHQACFDCLVQHLFTATNSALKSKHRFRAKCPLCKAEYCEKDFVLYTSSK